MPANRRVDEAELGHVVGGLRAVLLEDDVPILHHACAGRDHERGPRKRSAAARSLSALPAATRHLLPDRRSSGQRRGTGRQVRGLPVGVAECTEAELEELREERARVGVAL